MKSTILRASSVLALVTSILMLSSCASTEPTLTPLPTPGSSIGAQEAASTSGSAAPLFPAPEPQSESESIEYGKKVLEAYLRISTEIANEHPEDTSALGVIARDEAAEQVQELADRLVERDERLTQTTMFAIDDSRTIVSGEEDNAYGVGEFVYVEFYGCVTISGANNGALPDQVRNGWVLARYFPEEGAWFMSNTTIDVEGDGVPQC